MHHLAAVVVLLGLTTTAVAETTAPVPLRTPQLATPNQTAGTGMAPEVSVRVVVGVDGRIGDVEVVSVQPSSAWDEVFRTSTREQLSEWRYLPATEAGEAVATELTFKIQFQAASGLDTSRNPGVTTIHHSASLRESILALPTHLRRQLLERQIELGLTHLTQGRVERFDTSRFQIYTDSGNAQIAESLATNLEVAFNTLDSLFSAELERQDEPLKIVVFLYDHNESLRRFSAALRYNLLGRGFYSGTGLIAFTRETPDPDALLSLMLHEATHAYVDRYLTRQGVRLPSWFSEGLAEYVGTSQVKKGELIPGRILERRYMVNHLPGGTATRVQTGAGVRMRQGKQALREESLSLTTLLEAGPDIFYGDQSSAYYATGWLLVHFLRHGEEGWEDRFPELLLYAVEGYPLREAIETVYDRSLEDLEAPFLRYVRRL